MAEEGKSKYTKEELDAIIAQHEKLNKSTKDLTKSFENFSKSLGDTKKSLKEQAAMFGELKRAEIDLLDVKRARAAQEGDRRKELQAVMDMDAQLQEIQLAALAATGEEKEKLKKQEDMLIDAMGMSREELAKLKEEYATFNPLVAEATKEGRGFAEGLATAVSNVFPIYSKAMTGMYNKLGDFQKQLSKPGGPAAFVKGMRQIINAKNMTLAVTAQVVSATVELAMATDKATAAFAAQTGAGRALTGTISDVAGANRNLGLSAELTGKAAGDLFEGFTGFMQAGKDAQDTLVKTVATLGRIGVDGKTAAGALTLFNKNMGLSIKQSTKLTKDLAMMGTKIGISSKQMVSGFVAASKQLAVYGKDAIKVFSDLAAQAKAANVETSTLLGLAKKFDTFSGAADAAGKLNSILGTQLSATELLTMKENERIETLIRSIQAQGMAFKDMDKFSQMAIANAAGITDMAEAQRIFGMSVNDYRNGMRQSAEEEEFNQNLKDTMTIVEKLKKAGQAFAISFGPAIDTLAGFVQTLADFNQQSGSLIYIIGAVGFLMVTLKALAVISPILAAFGVIGPTAGAGFAAMGTGIAAAAPGIATGIGPLLGLAAAMVILGLAFYLMGGSYGEAGGMAILGMMAAVAAGILLLGGAVAILGLYSPLIFFGALALGTLSLGLLGLASSMEKLPAERLKDLATVIGGLSGETEIKTNLITDVKDFTDSLISKEAVLKPMLGDLALIATGTTSEGITANVINYDFKTFAAEFKNIFQPQITVKIGDKELKGMIDEQQAKNSMDTNK
jgi:hypothetical protein